MNTTEFQELLDARKGADGPLAFAPYLHCLLQLKGKDGLDLLQRLAASDLAGMADGESRPLLLTNEKGRIIDLAICFRMKADELIVLCGPGRREKVAAWIDRFTIMEELQTQSLDAGWAWLFMEQEPAVVPAGTWLANDPDLEGSQAKVLLVGPECEGDDLSAALAKVRFGDAGEWNQWRVSQGRLAFGPGLDGELLNPLEAGFQFVVSFTKGCYVGQEVVARLDTYQKVRRERRLLKGSGATPPIGSELLGGEKLAGILLDSAAAPEGQGWSAVAVLKVGASDLALRGPGSTQVHAD